ncbi:MAG: hypothetical protein ACM359_13955 [Bacillota bacterium]
MKYRRFKHGYHDSFLVGFSVGPLEEITLTIDLNPGWVSGGGTVSVRFGGVQNLEAVRAFLSQLKQPQTPHAYLADIVYLTYTAKQAPNGANRVLLVLERQGAIHIECQHVSEH